MIMCQFIFNLYSQNKRISKYMFKTNKIKQMNNQKQTRSTHQNTQSRDSTNPQNSSSIRKAAARLKQKQAQIDIIKKRFLVLKGQQQYNRYRTLDQQRRIKNHITIHQSIKLDRSSLQKKLTQLKQTQQKQLKERHDKIQQQMKDNNKQIYANLMASRISERNKLKQQSKINDMMIDNNRQELILQNSKKKQSVLSQQKKQKMLVKQYRNNHAKQTLSNRSMEASRLTQMTEAKDKQLQKLMNYEQEMLKKASESIAMNQRLKSQFGKVFVDVKQRNYVKFPAISRQSHSYRTNQSDLSRNLSIYEI